MLYFDTSFLVPLILIEPTSVQVQRFFRRHANEGLVISEWTRVEFSSLLARDVRMGVLARKNARRADAQFEELVEPLFEMLLPVARDFDLAKRYLQNYGTGLRAPDACIWRSQATIGPAQSIRSTMVC